MNDIDLATCHCIISHPSKPKFMVIRHSDGWRPPVVKFPAEGFIGSKAQVIADGVLNKYGLKVIVLRHLVESSALHYIELELLAPHGTKKIEAVWVGKNEYQQFRRSKPGQFDPLADWLVQAQKRHVPPKRPPWERKGWFKKAAGWIEHELDRRNIQLTGSVQQHRACRRSSSVLRVRSSQGRHFFKAAWNAPPNEAALTVALADRWPEAVSRPLAFDTSRNWLLMQANREDDGTVPGDDDYLTAARTLADIQFESSRDLGKWKSLGCQNRGTKQLAEFLDSNNDLTPALQSGEGGLNDEELLDLNSRFRDFRTVCHQLAAYDIPETLIHSDFHRSNLIWREGGFWIIDWADAVISHPFFSSQELMRSIESPGSGPGTGAGRGGEAAVHERIKDAFMAPFTVFESPDRLREAFALTAEIYNAWKLYLWSHQLAYIEPESVSYAVWARTMQGISRNLLAKIPGKVEPHAAD